MTNFCRKIVKRSLALGIELMDFVFLSKSSKSLTLGLVTGIQDEFFLPAYYFVPRMQPMQSSPKDKDFAFEIHWVTLEWEQRSFANPILTLGSEIQPHHCNNQEHCLTLSLFISAPPYLNLRSAPGFSICSAVAYTRILVNAG